jgi:sigma-B regulation protein RsbU (phosphoserine phosphatase)
MNKTLSRILKKSLGMASREQLTELLLELESQFADPSLQEKRKGFFQDILELIDITDRSFTDLDRAMYLRDSSLAISSREMTSLTEEIQAQSSRQAAILSRLQGTIRLLTQSEAPSAEVTATSENEEQEMENLVEMVDFLVRTKVDSAKLQKILFEEGVKICSVLSFRNLEVQLRSSVVRLVGPDTEVEIFFSGALFEEKDAIDFYQCNEFNQPLEEQRLSTVTSEGHHYLTIESPKANGTLAMIQLNFNRKLTPEELHFRVTRISPLIPSVASTLENINLLKEEKKKQHMESELNTIRLVQQTLLPPSSPMIHSRDLEVSGYYQSATECSGDWWTYFHLKDGRHVILVGDVTGHGTGSAMVCGVVKGYCDSFFNRHQITMSEVLTELNAVIHRMAKDSSRAMTMSAIAIDTSLGTATFANAGHPLPILIQGSGNAAVSRHLINSGPILGLQAECSYKEVTFEFKRGDRMVIYSDGLTECTNTQELMYGENRLRRLVKSFDFQLSANELNRAILHDVNKFSMGESFKDDMTTVVVRAV